MRKFAESAAEGRDCYVPRRTETSAMSLRKYITHWTTHEVDFIQGHYNTLEKERLECSPRLCGHKL